MELMELSLIFSALFSEIAGTISWFGSSSIFLPIAHQFFDYQNAIILVAIYHIFWNTSRLAITYKHWDKKIFLLFGIPSIFATIIGASLVGKINSDYLKLGLWIVLTLFAIYSLWKPKFHIEPTPLLGRIGWILSWFTAGIIGTGWVLRGAFMTLFGLSKERYIATIASIALLVDFTRIPIYFWQWFLSDKYFFYIPILLIVAFIGSIIWKGIVRLMPVEVLKKVILVGIIIISIHLGWQGFLWLKM
jgi:uncharacterized protein